MLNSKEIIPNTSPRNAMTQSVGGGDGGYEKSNQVDALADRLILEIKALMILGRSDGESLDNLVKERIAFSQDSQVADFSRIIKETGQEKPKVNSLIFMALGEMILASVMAILGLAILAPSVGGLDSPSKILNYFAQVFQSTASSQSSLSPVVSAVEVILSLLLIMGAFYSLRKAATTLKESRLEGPR